MGEAPIKTIERNAATKQMRVSFTMSASLIFGEAAAVCLRCMAALRLPVK